MKTVAIVQARMTSTRLPGKVLMPLAGKPMLEQQVLRMQRAFDDIVIATTDNASDDGIIALAKRLSVRTFRGSEHDVLSRYVGAAREAKADRVVRLTADCPLLDPDVCKAVVDTCQDCDYASNILKRTFPRGLDTEVFYRDVLERTHRMASSAPAREHVTYYIYKEAPQLHVLRSYEAHDDFSHLSWTVDTPEDFARVSALVERTGDAQASYQELLRFI